MVASGFNIVAFEFKISRFCQIFAGIV